VRKWTKKAAGGGVVWLAGLLFGGVFLTTEGTEVTEEGLAGHCLLSTFSALASEAWMLLPPHPRPLSPGGGEGSLLVFLWL
jgi:hypothetical protein